MVKTADFDSVIEGSNPSTEANISLSYHFFIILNDENAGSNPVTRLTFQSGKGKLWALRIQSAGSFVLDECALVSTTTRRNFFTVATMNEPALPGSTEKCVVATSVWNGSLVG